LVSLEHGTAPNGYGLWLYYGRNFGHGHQDCLNIGLFAHGVDLLPELGYPDYATRYYPKLREWTANTISHNTVVVDKVRQEQSWSGKTRFVKFLPGVRAAEISGGVYAQATDYRRLIALIETPDGQAYAWDVFRVAGGSDHLLSYHGPEGRVAVSGLSFVEQAGGTYGGKNIPPGSHIEGAGEGFSYLTNVRRCGNPPAGWSVTYEVASQWLPDGADRPVGLRLHHFTEDLREVSLCENLKPSQRSRVEKLTYVLARREASSRGSAFVTILDPFAGLAAIVGVRSLKAHASAGLPVAVEVTLPDGFVDYLFSAPASGVELRTENGWSCDAPFAHVRTRQGKIETLTVIQGSRFAMLDAQVQMEAAFVGAVTRFDEATTEHTSFATDAALPAGTSLEGETVIFESEASHDVSYCIKRVDQENRGSRVSVGLDSFAIGYRGTGDTVQGLRYAITRGSQFRIANHVQGRRKLEGWNWKSLSPFSVSVTP
jgi:hypothetical protein